MSESFARLDRRPSVHESVQAAIRTYILEHGLGPGDAMAPEGELARQLGVSRNSVREAVRSLESLGVLESRQGSGLFVRAFSWDPLLDNLAYGLMRDVRKVAELLEIRKVLEVGMVADAVERLTEVQLAELRLLLERMRVHAAEGSGFPDEDRRFHRVLFEELQNDTFLKLLDIFWLAFRKASEGADLLDDDPERTYEAHRRIVEALAARDVDRTRTALLDHYTFIAARLKNELDAGSAAKHHGQKEVPPDEP